MKADGVQRCATSLVIERGNYAKRENKKIGPVYVNHKMLTKTSNSVTGQLLVSLIPPTVTLATS